ncbi:AI-2E family transporter [Corynebacterium sp. 13CS0277]|uniref:AI-2E family transporter n=1 Tax=Corynebacterium sp. 13CS0277 TaxID=2071994 RepID=UPI001E610AB0|nr:AI-2E family transporter [Corynebacterium sp. 13CS0277]
MTTPPSPHDDTSGPTVVPVADEAPGTVDRTDVIAAAVKELAWWCVRLLVIGITAFAAWWGLGLMGQALLPLALALIISTVLITPTAWLRRAGVPAGLASMVVILTSFSIAGSVVFFVAPDVVRQSHTLYYQAVQGIQQLELWLQGPPLNARAEDLERWFSDGAAWLQQRMGLIAGQVFAGLGMAGSVIVNLMVITVLTFFFLKDGSRFLPWLTHVTGHKAGRHLAEVLTRCWNTLSGFIRAQALVSLVDAVFIGAGLVMLGIPMALALATLTFIAGFVPIVGAVVAGLVAVLVAFVSHGMTHAIIVTVLVIVVQQLEGNVLSPLLQSRAMNLHPVIVLLSVTVGGAQFGIPGAFFAVPVAAMIAVIIRYLGELIDWKTGEINAEDLYRATHPDDIHPKTGGTAPTTPTTPPGTHHPAAKPTQAPEVPTQPRD